MNIPFVSLRKKIIIRFIFVIMIGGFFSLLLGSRLVRNTLISQAQAKVRHDLAAAWMVFNEKQNQVKDIIIMTAARESLHEIMRSRQYDILLRYLMRVREEYGLDILTLTDAQGRVILRTRNPKKVGDDQSREELIRKALQGEVHASPQIISREELLKEGDDLAERAYIEFVPTLKAAARVESHESNGLMLKAATAVIDDRGQLLGILYGGILLNRNYEIVDRVKELVYKDEQYKGREIGTVTIFQNDLRISTNVETSQGKRAIGTRVSAEVNRAVLQNGEGWTDRAFVVNEWYITAYEPIKDIAGQIIGILYVGMLEKPYLDISNRVMLTFILIAGSCVVLLLVLLYFATNRLINPLLRMMVATQEIARGDLYHRVEVQSDDEIGYLAESFNQMTEKLRAANEKLLEWGKTLEKKVEERTQELTMMQAHLLQSEKLASLGKLAAGIAHEINNPLGGILIYSHLLLEDTPKDDPHYPNLKKIVKETSRCKDIVKGLLEFARPKDPEMSPTDINQTIDKALSILEGHSQFQNIQIIKKYSTLPRIFADGDQLQQVFMNIILNASEAMEDNGTLSLRTELVEEDKYISVEFRDTGHGIEKEDQQRLFEPFFTTKEVGKGTGLGLAISYSIIRKHRGTIKVVSAVGKGSTFVVKLPIIKDSDHE